MVQARSDAKPHLFLEGGPANFLGLTLHRRCFPQLRLRPQYHSHSRRLRRHFHWIQIMARFTAVQSTIQSLALNLLPIALKVRATVALEN